MLQQNRIAQTEAKFKQLLLSQPDHFDGCEGLAELHRQQGHKDKALFFIEEAIRRTEVFLQNDQLDQEVMDLLPDQQSKIQTMSDRNS